ncbi:class I SAM-dependent methyltransferase [Flavobacteriaceae bacterium]|nr:class I SAM-dependent methyltransferase [Flavobacteriaceae bacterium]
MNKQNIKLYFEWDTISWSRTLLICHKYLESNRGKYVLEVGSRHGGLSLMLAKEYGMEVVCSDLNNPETSAQLLHKKYITNHTIQYKAIDCMQIDYKDNSFDFVFFKSVIGALGACEKQSLAFQEIFCVLKPGGVLLFAENLECSVFHMYLRRKFVPWSSHWHYPKLNDINLFLENYNFVEINTTGFFATFARAKFIRTFLSYFDVVIDKILPKKNKYIVYGAAIK